MSAGGGPRRVVLVRHTSVEEACRGRCYGSSDVELSEQGRNEACELAARLAEWPITHLFHSGLARSRECAELVAQRCGVVAVAAPELAEMHFGDWELCTWDAIHTAAPDALDRLLAEPATFAPPGGETVFAVRDRVLRWYRQLPATGLIVAIAHGGPIAALRGTLAGLPPADWPQLIPRHGEIVELE
ncbi:MAG TPA: histidine phosphatase family protein [Pirellulales bacterium]|jgi:broad specificity phosphatase PhoE|nr:histidine phosphatase family protein [Pirellulales bacterium]